MERSELVANAIELSYGVQDYRNIVAVVTPHLWQGNKSFLLLASGVNPVCADTKQRLIVARRPHVPRERDTALRVAEVLLDLLTLFVAGLYNSSSYSVGGGN